MVSLETGHPPPRASDAAASSPRISFSAEFLDDKNFISISPKAHHEKEREMDIDKAEFEFLSTDVSLDSMLSADELFCEGKLLPFWQMQQSERLNKISLSTKDDGGDEEGRGEAAKDNKEQSKTNWFLDDDPSPRPPKCTVLWKELLRLKKQRTNSSLSLSPSSSSSSTSSSSNSMADAAAKDEKKEAAAARGGEKQAKRIRKGLERTRSASIRIRPMITVPICTPAKSSALPPLFPLKKGRLDR